MNNLFVGAKESEETGAARCLNAFKDSCAETEAGMDFSILQEVSSIVIDGTNMNIGVSLVPLIKICCAVHRSNLAWKSVTDTVTELKVVIEAIKSISTYFHTLGVRTRERKKVADEHNLPMLRYPVYFQIRFTEFLFELIDAYLSSCEATIFYFHDKSKEP